MNRREFMLYLEETLIPDLKESGLMATARDFETCLEMMDTKPLIQIISDLHHNIIQDVPADRYTRHLSDAVHNAGEVLLEEYGLKVHE